MVGLAEKGAPAATGAVPNTKERNRHNHTSAVVLAQAADMVLAPPIVIEKNQSNDLHLTLERYRSHVLFSLRPWFRTGAGTSKPAAGGFGMRIERLPDFVEAIAELRALAASLGLLSINADDADPEGVTAVAEPPERRMIANCAVCRNFFETTRETARYCSARCRQRASRTARAVTDAAGKAPEASCDRVTESAGP